jgi:hypothetical protein
MRAKRAIVIAGGVAACVALGGAGWFGFANRLPPPTALLLMSQAERDVAIAALREAEEPPVGADGGPALRAALGPIHVLSAPANLGAAQPYLNLEMAPLPLAGWNAAAPARQGLVDAGMSESLAAVDSAGWIAADFTAVDAMGLPGPDARATRTLVRVLVIEMKIAAAGGDDAALSAHFARALRIGRTSALGLDTLPWIVGASMRISAFMAVADLSAAGAIGPDAAERLLEVVGRDAGMPSAESALRAVAIRECSPDNPLATWSQDDLRRSGPRLEACREELIGLIGAPTTSLPRLPGERDIVEERFPGANLLPSAISPAPRLDFADSYRASGLNILHTLNSEVQAARACRIALAMELYRAEHGAYPESLDALGLPDQTLTSAITGERVLLRMFETPDDMGRRWVLDSGEPTEPERRR